MDSKEHTKPIINIDRTNKDNNYGALKLIYWSVDDSEYTESKSNIDSSNNDFNNINRDKRINF